MPTIPSANVSISAEAGALAGGTGYCVVIAPVGTNADSVPRVYSSHKALLAQHNYAPGVSFAASFIEKTRKPVIFCGIPAAVAGTIGQHDDTGVTGTSVITVAAGAAGVLEELDASLTVTNGGTIGTNGIEFEFSADGGRTVKKVRLGTASSYTVPYLGIVISFAAGTLVADDVYTFKTTAPGWDGDGITLARTKLAAQQKLARSWMVIGDVATAAAATLVANAANTYETSNQRFVFARVNVKDRLPFPAKSKVGGETLTFATAGDTITRTGGSWLADGFKVGDSPVFDGTVSNDGAKTITALTATVMTVSENLVDETIDSEDVTATVEQTMAAWVSAADATFTSIDAQKRVDIGLGRGLIVCPITGWNFRRPASWGAAIREYQHDVHTATWQKEDGPLDFVSLEDEDGQVVEYDERTDGGALAGRFTCYRTWANGPNGAFVAMSLTRDEEGSVLSYTHNMAVANVFCTVVQQATENVVGKSLVLKDDGTAEPASLEIIEEAINTDLEQALLREFVPGEGQRASKALWRADPTSILSHVGARLNGAGELNVNGTIVDVNTSVKVR